jgi:RNA polymerase sigma-70 factor (ECF subfamily)
MITLASPMKQMTAQSFDNFDEKELVTLLQKDNIYAYELIFRRYYVSLCGFATRFMQHPEDAEEIVQNIFLKLWENKDTIQIHLSLKSYLFRATYNACNNELSHDRIKKRYIAYAKDTLLKNECFSDPVTDSLAYKELNDAITEAIERLPNSCKDIFKMSRFDGLKYAEIASQLNISVKTVETQISRALAKLREGLKEFMVDK